MSRIYINLNEEYMGAIYASNDDESVFENLNIEYDGIIKESLGYFNSLDAFVHSIWRYEGGK